MIPLSNLKLTGARTVIYDKAYTRLVKKYFRFIIKADNIYWL